VRNELLKGIRINIPEPDPVVFANHGALVARPGESSLERLVGELTRDIPAEGEGAVAGGPLLIGCSVSQRPTRYRGWFRPVSPRCGS
jgi:hypothetical protein